MEGPGQPRGLLMSRVMAWVSSERPAWGLHWSGSLATESVSLCVYYPTEERTCRNGKVLDHRQLSAFFFFLNQCLEISPIWTEKSGKIHHEHQQSVYNEGLFISDHFFTAIYPGITPTCESQAQIHLKKCSFLVLTLQAFLSQETVFP